MPVSEVDSMTAQELEALQKEFPDWKDQYPEMYTQMHPQIYSKMRTKNDWVKTAVPNKGQPAPPTDYQATYQRHGAYRARSSKRPPPTPRDTNPPAMTFATNQRSAFTPKDVASRTQPIIHGDQYEQPGGTSDGMTHYQREYPVRQLESDIKVQAANRAHDKVHLGSCSAKFQSGTTTKEHFKPWRSEPPKPYAELPSFAGSLLYPENGLAQNLQTTTGKTFKGCPGSAAKLCNVKEGNLKLDGDMDMNTTNKATYHSYDNVSPSKRFVQKQDLKIGHKSKFNSLSQTKSDYPGYRGMQPSPPKPAEPYPATIDLKFNDRQLFSTEQRRQFKGVDASSHPVPKSFHQEQEYTPPTVKFETATSQKVSYQPIALEEVTKPARKPASRRPLALDAKFEDTTTNNEFFKKWDVPQQRVRYGDFHESHSYIPPASRFNSRTTNQDTFVAKSAPIPRSFKPEDNAIDFDGDHDFSTMYKTKFSKPLLAKALSGTQAQTLLQALRKRKQANTLIRTQSVC